ncbi:TlyA family RNA methyltransferase [Phenylobacterium immobile]|uniref:TlyA family RNA methyltransferase n=1 Tax=Phenylobacterium immobile TaxID=21 RepID=UPI000AAFE486|nr:TlyA family RNA methyltransferase [Phenylobacterium immobile]
MKQRADLLLVARGLFDSRAKARAAIEAGGVTADGRPVTRAAELIGLDAEIVAAPAHPWVGRGGLKLAHAFKLWEIEVVGKTVVDVGASTGGFTQVCLEAGAARVFAVDVGRGQLHPSLAVDSRVTNLEATDARALTRALVPAPIHLVVSDVSFIGLAKALPAALELAEAGAVLVCLVKPQFEAGPGVVGKGGIIKDLAVRRGALERVVGWLNLEGWTVQATADSPIVGGDGNHEFLLWAVKRRWTSHVI